MTPYMGQCLPVELLKAYARIEDWNAVVDEADLEAARTNTDVGREETLRYLRSKGREL